MEFFDSLDTGRHGFLTVDQLLAPIMEMAGFDEPSARQFIETLDFNGDAEVSRQDWSRENRVSVSSFLEFRLGLEARNVGVNFNPKANFGPGFSGSKVSTRSLDLEGLASFKNTGFQRGRLH